MSGVGHAEVRGFIFDANRCTGCSACALACSTENQLGWGRSWRQVVSVNPERRPELPTYHLSLACNHCDDAPCMEQCPTGAIARVGTGAVLIDPQVCIGCRYCSWVCPYDAPRFDHQRAVMGKCTACHHRLVEGGVPACVEACPTAALDFGALSGSSWLPGFPETPAGPRIAFRTLRAGPRPVESSWGLPGNVLAAFARSGVPSGNAEAISLRSEAPLALFTLGAAVLVGWVLAALWGRAWLHPVGFGVGAVATLAISTLHLGRKLRAWQAIRSLRTSRLSREVAAYGAFVGVGAAASLAGPGQPAILVAAGALGMAALFLMDRVYDPVRQPGARPVHSADVVLTGPLLGAAMAGSPWLLTAVAAGKLALYLGRKVGEGRGGGRWSLVPAAVRVLGGLAAPVVLGWYGAAVPWVLVPALLGEGLDRAEFYQGLKINTPRDTAARVTTPWRDSPSGGRGS